MHIRPDEWKNLIELRDDLEGEDKTLLRKLMKYVEHLQDEIKHMKALLHQAASGNYKPERDDDGV